MHSITVVFGPTSLRFLFKSKEKADAIRSFRVDHPTQDMIIDDDFGQHAEIKSGSIHGLIFEDMDQSKLAAVEMLLHDARMRSTASNRAQSDPALRAARSGPAVLTPMNGLGPQ